MSAQGKLHTDAAELTVRPNEGGHLDGGRQSDRKEIHETQVMAFNSPHFLALSTHFLALIYSGVKTIWRAGSVPRDRERY
jgi:hypothetical protein